jgi:predicted RNA methylase
MAWGNDAPAFGANDTPAFQPSFGGNDKPAFGANDAPAFAAPLNEDATPTEARAPDFDTNQSDFSVPDAPDYEDEDLTDFTPPQGTIDQGQDTSALDYVPDEAENAEIDAAQEKYEDETSLGGRFATRLKSGGQNLMQAGRGIAIMHNLDQMQDSGKLIEYMRGQVSDYRAAIEANPDMNPRQLDSISRSIRQMESGIRINTMNLRARERDFRASLKNFAETNAEVSAAERNPVAQRAMQAEDFQDWWHWFQKDPVGFIAQVGTESLPLMAPSIGLGAVGGAVAGPVGFAVGMGIGSGGVDFALTLMDQIREHGGDINDPKSVEKIFKKYGDEIKEFAFKRGAAIGVFDGASARVAGFRFFKPKTLRAPGIVVDASTKAERVASNIGNAAAQTVPQGVMGGAGEATALKATGQPLAVGDIAAEVFGELAQSPVESGGAVISANKPQDAPVTLTDNERTDAHNIAVESLNPNPQPAGLPPVDANADIESDLTVDHLRARDAVQDALPVGYRITADDDGVTLRDPDGLTLVTDPAIDELEDTEKWVAAAEADAEQNTQADNMSAAATDELSALQKADLADESGVPQVGASVTVTYPEGGTISGDVVDVFEIDGAVAVQVKDEEGGVTEVYPDEAVITPAGEELVEEQNVAGAPGVAAPDEQTAATPLEEPSDLPAEETSPGARVSRPEVGTGVHVWLSDPDSSVETEIEGYEDSEDGERVIFTHEMPWGEDYALVETVKMAPVSGGVPVQQAAAPVAEAAAPEPPKTQSHPAGYGKTKKIEKQVLGKAKARLEKKKALQGRVSVRMVGGSPRLVIQDATAAENALAAEEIARQAQIKIDAAQRGRVRGGPVKGPQTLVEWISSRGGIIDRSGELSAMDMDKWHLDAPFRRKFIREAFDGAQGDLTGGPVVGNPNFDYEYEQVFEAAVDEGYFPELAGQDIRQLDGRQFILDSIAGGPRYSDADRAEIEAKEVAKKAEVVGDRRAEIEAEIASFGFNISDEGRQKAINAYEADPMAELYDVVHDVVEGEAILWFDANSFEQVSESDINGIPWETNEDDQAQNYGYEEGGGVVPEAEPQPESVPGEEDGSEASRGEPREADENEGAAAEGSLADFDPAQHVKIAADDISKLRKQDVYRLFEALDGTQNWGALYDHIYENRQDLVGEALDAIDELDLRRDTPEEAAEKAREEKEQDEQFAKFKAENKAMGEEIVEILENGGSVILRTQTKATKYTDPATVRVTESGPVFQAGKRWDAVTRDQLNDMLANAVRGAKPDVRDKEIGDVLETDEQTAPRDEGRDRRELVARRAGKKTTDKTQKEADHGLFAAADKEAPLEKAAREEAPPDTSQAPATKDEKPLFVPLKTEWYEAFEDGSKTEEFRQYGKRWNEKTVRVGRKVLLSHGYSVGRRLLGTVSSFTRQHATTLSDEHKKAVEEIFGTLDVEMAVIGVSDLVPVGTKNAPPDTPQEPAAPEQKAPAKAGVSDSVRKKAERLRDSGVKLEEKASGERTQDRLENTPKRAREGASARARAAADEQIAKTAQRIADMIIDGEAGPLASVSSIADVRQLESMLKMAMHRADRKNNKSYSDQQRDEGRPMEEDDFKAAEAPHVHVHPEHKKQMLEAAKGTKGLGDALSRVRSISSDFVSRKEAVEAVRAVAKATKGKAKWASQSTLDSLRDYDRKVRLGVETQEQAEEILRAYSDVRSGRAKEDPIKAAERNLVGNKIPGFFATPEALAQRVIDEADIREGHSVLEPSAGSGRLADAASLVVGQENVTLVEQNHSLREILELKGYSLADSNFLEHEGEYDRIVMNPPFEKGQDMEHVQRAFEMLKPGGRVVSIMSPSPFFNGNGKAAAFREWFEDNGGSMEKLPDNSFKDSGTGVGTVLVVLDKGDVKESIEDEPTTEKIDTVDGPRDQFVLPGAERKAPESVKGRKKGKSSQKGVDALPLFGGDPSLDQGTLFRMTSEFSTSQDAVLEDLRAELDRLGLHDVALAIEKLRKGAGGATITEGGAVRIVLSALAKRPGRTLRHEVIHALKALGLISKGEWNALVRMADKEGWLTRKWGNESRTVNERYAHLTEGERYEEAVAEWYANGGPEKAKGLVARAVNKIKRFFEALGNALRKNGFTTAEGIFEDIEAGKTGRRPRVVEIRDGAQEHRGWHATVHKWENNRADISKVGSGEGVIDEAWGLYFGSDVGTGLGYVKYFGKSETRLYEVELSAKLSDYLDWDKKLSDQPEKVRDAFLRAAPVNQRAIEGLEREIEGQKTHIEGLREKGKERLASGSMTKEAVDSAIAFQESFVKENQKLIRDLKKPHGADSVFNTMTGRKAYLEMSERLGGKKAASQALLKEGLPGVRYTERQDQFTVGSSNYVVFDDSLISVVDEFEPGGIRFSIEDDLYADGDPAGIERTAKRGKKQAKRRTEEAPQGDLPTMGSTRNPDLKRTQRERNQERDEALSEGRVYEESDQGETGEAFATIPESASREAAKKKKQQNTQQDIGGTWHFSDVTVATFLQDESINRLARIRGVAGVAATEFRRLAQDKFINLKRVQEKITESRGRDLEDGVDAYLAEELYHGRTGKRLDDFQNNKVEPLIDAIEDEGLSLEDVELFLYARHAEERNTQIAKINEDMPDGGSGMTDQEASDILANFVGQTAALNRIAAMVDAINVGRLDILQKGGLIDARTRANWERTYQNYVPLRGFEEADEAVDVGIARTGKGFDTRGDESARALGRESRAGDILAYTFAQYEEALVRSEKNLVAKTLLKLVTENPNPELWTVDEVSYTRKADPKTGLVKVIPDQAAKRMDNVLAAKVDGKVHHITFNPESPTAMKMARAMKNLGAENMNTFLQVLQSANRYLANMNTNMNPEFIISNALRDMQTALINIQGLNVDTKGLTKAVIRDYAKALVAVKGGLDGKSDTAWQKAYHEFASEGGKIAFFGLEDIQSRATKINKLISDINPSNGRRVIMLGKQLLKLISDVNAAVENAVRLSTYMNLRRRGVTKKRAASIARNLTVNFNRKGEYGALMGSLFLFYNASFQGTVRMMQALKSKPVRRLAAGIVFGSMALDILNSFLSPDDDDDPDQSVYDKISPWTKDHNFILMNPWAENPEDAIAVSFPYSYGYNVMAVTGTKMGEVARGKTSPLVAAVDIIASAVDAFNPLGGAPSVTQFFTPTVLKPFVQIGENKNFMGAPVFPTPVAFDGAPPPDSEMYWGRASGMSKAVSRYINSLTGGNAVRPGSIAEMDTSISPEVLDHFYEFFVGGAGAFVKRAGEFGFNVATGGDVEWRDVPFLRRIIQGRNDWADRQRYYEIRGLSAYAKKEQKVLEGDENAEARETYAVDKRMVPIIKAAEKMLKTQRKRRARIQESGTRTAIQKRDAVAVIEKKMARKMRLVIRKYNQFKRAEK